ncbi:MAG: PhnD/SsuA/transferrin family substrate-binding protein [Anaerolineales bacterium]|nr:PhnD/SsuA/transferrin family substrate-binding protein [Anaerolineales bacterium]
MLRRIILPGLASIPLLLLGCNLTFIPVSEVPTPSPKAPATQTPIPTSPPALVLGTRDNPLILALPPDTSTQAQVDSGNYLAEKILELTGYAVVTSIPDSYTALIEDLEKGNAHMAALPPFAYVHAYQLDLVQAGLATLEGDAITYGAQLIANQDAGFTSYYNAKTKTNFEDADEKTALQQFTGKHPCWTNAEFASGNTVPAGLLSRYGIETAPAVVLQSHHDVVRALRYEGFCDFGATYIDARTFPALQEEFPDVMEEIVVIWRIPNIIPYDVVSFSTRMPPGAHEEISQTILTLSRTIDGAAALQTAFGIQYLETTDDYFYTQFREDVIASGADLETLYE